MRAILVTCVYPAANPHSNVHAMIPHMSARTDSHFRPFQSRIAVPLACRHHGQSIPQALPPQLQFSELLRKYQAVLDSCGSSSAARTRHSCKRKAMLRRIQMRIRRRCRLRISIGCFYLAPRWGMPRIVLTSRCPWTVRYFPCRIP